jgi:hypothetical protein
MTCTGLQQPHREAGVKMTKLITAVNEDTNSHNKNDRAEYDIAAFQNCKLTRFTSKIKKQVRE